MWFARLFGARNDDSDEPARFPNMPAPRPAQSALATAKPATGSKTGKPASKGFDPYNSGAFQRKNAWERVNRR